MIKNTNIKDIVEYGLDTISDEEKNNNEPERLSIHQTSFRGIYALST